MGNPYGLVCIAMLAFAANSLLCRMALANTDIDPGLFTTIRLASGALCLALLVAFTARRSSKNTSPIAAIKQQASIAGALSLFVYAIAFSYAYISMSTGTGALLLFGAVQLTMISVGLLKGERFATFQWLGFLLAFAGLVILLLPGASAPPLFSALLMISAGIAWGFYSLLGKKSNAPLLLTAGNFLYATLLTLPLIVWLWVTDTWQWSNDGVLFALASGIVASGCGYAIWYKALPLIQSTTAATVQLSVPVIATLMGWAFLAEAISVQIMVASLMTLGGIWLVIKMRKA
ncbi:DMT family transporter [Alteromonas stellipolaris]|jgi:drug/metabolite transporter (DMT)-like permease|uniref:DMT family transporter n=1 Tax=Alteromonas stellipolaris TaxID=233316 RepID=UPI002118256C|nr:DMT family transporter [Alteromonas stellipolaris]MCQ8850566.1 DMT family transporter [Alteromonas stellipolaris]|tara:strand:- start:3034 stop:3903 length:870 start_codon:yes stop_codon:yes gene_type:complete